MKKLTVALSCRTDIVVFDKLLLFSDHIFEVNNRTRLKLQIQ